MTAVDEEAGVPEFTHALRGYDRYQVDDYVQRLNEWAVEAQSRAVESERVSQTYAREVATMRQRVNELEAGPNGVPDDTLREVADRVASSLNTAVEESTQIRRRAEAQAEQRVAEANEAAAATVAAVQKAIGGLRQEVILARREARREAETILEEARTESEHVRRVVAERAETVIGEAEGEAARMISEAEQTVSRLRVERTQIVEELNSLRGAIQTLITATQPRSEETTQMMPNPDQSGPEYGHV